jgi:hypothetical protein
MEVVFRMNALVSRSPRLQTKSQGMEYAFVIHDGVYDEGEMGGACSTHVGIQDFGKKTRRKEIIWIPRRIYCFVGYLTTLLY